MSRVMCKISEDRQITFAERRTFPVCLHLVGNEAQDNISGPFAGQYLHRAGSSLKLFVDTLDDVRGS